MSNKRELVGRVTTRAVSIFLILSLGYAVVAAQVKVDVNHDMTQQTLGFQSPSSSKVSYDDRNGLSVQGAIQNLLGPPIKIAHGFGNMFQGSNMAGIGSSLKNSGAIVGLDSKLLEAAGGASLLKGGLLLGGSAAKVGAATALKGLPGKKIASIIEMPVKIVALGDIAAGKALKTLGNAKSQEVQQTTQRGDEMIKQGDALRQQGLQQVLQGASEGAQNLGNVVQQTAGNAADAIRLLPIMMNMQNQQQHPVEQQEAVKSALPPTKQRSDSSPHQLQQSTLTGGSLFGGLGSLLPGIGESPFSHSSVNGNGGSALSNLFGFGGDQNNGLAAVLSASNPFTNFLMNPSLNPILMPLGGAGSSLGQGTKTSAGSGGLFGVNLDRNGQSSTTTYNLFPGLRLRETISSQPSQFGSSWQHHGQQHQTQSLEKTQPIDQSVQQVEQGVKVGQVEQAPLQQVESFKAEAPKTK